MPTGQSSQQANCLGLIIDPVVFVLNRTSSLITPLVAAPTRGISSATVTPTQTLKGSDEWLLLAKLKNLSYYCIIGPAFTLFGSGRGLSALGNNWRESSVQAEVV